MTYRVVFAPEADAQLIALYNYVASKASPDTARRFTDSIIDHCEGFKTFPRRGTRRDDIHEGLRIVGYRKRVTIAFTLEKRTVTISGIFYGGQDYQRTLAERLT